MWRYSRIQTSDEEKRDGIVLHEQPTSHIALSRVHFAGLIFCLVLLTGSNLFLVTRHWNSSNSHISPYTGLDTRPVDKISGYRASVYHSKNQTEADAAWEAINLGVGLVAVEKQWAMDQGLPMSRHYPPDARKLVYSVAAYHPLHCVPVIRNLVRKLTAGEDFSEHDHEHVSHCLGVIREELLCTASDALLHTSYDEQGNRIPTGLGQVRKCTNWEALRDWTLEHQACYMPWEDRHKHPEMAKWGDNCVDTDGIIIS